MEKRLQVLKVPKVPILKCVEGADWVPRCRAGAEVPGCWVPTLTPLPSTLIQFECLNRLTENLFLFLAVFPLSTIMWNNPYQQTTMQSPFIQVS
jgi:hypothetical protein